MAIDKFAVTANNVSYCLGGEGLYWSFYPADEQWGVVPVWGVGTVVESNNVGRARGNPFARFLPHGGRDRVASAEEKTTSSLSRLQSIVKHCPGLYSEYGNVHQ